ncbi:MAG: hypothetical protein ACKVQA_13675, partial [Burkholderiales bacterium]
MNRISLSVPGQCPGAVILRIMFVLGVWQMPHAMAEDYGRNGGAQGGTIRAGCKALADSTGREVSSDGRIGASASRPAHCPFDDKVAAPEPAPKVVEQVTPDPIDVGESPRDGGPRNSSLKVEPAGVGLAITSGGALFWILRSGLWASLLVMGLPVWRDLDLLPVVARGRDDSAVSNEAPDVAGEDVFSPKVQE